MFGRLASWISRHRRLQDPSQLARVIQHFLNNLKGRNWGADRCAFLLDRVHDWNSWLLDIGMGLRGHTGPSAPHWFAFMRRGQTADVEGLVEHPDVLSGSPADPDDVVLYCKQWMSSSAYSQPPLVVLRAACARSVNQPPVPDPNRRPLTAKYVSHILKFTKIMQQPPYNMDIAAQHLEQWVSGSLLDSDVLYDVRAVTTTASHAQELAQHRGQVDEGRVEEVDSLEPPAGVVALVHAVRGHARGRGRAAACDRITVVHDCATLLYQQVPDMTLPEAIRFGEACWRRVAGSHVNGRVARAPRLARDLDEAAGADDAGDPLDVES